MTDWGSEAATLLRELSAISEPGPGVTRLPYTPEHRAGLDLLTARMEMAGLTVSLDDAGTLIGRREGPPGAGTLLMGSHQDSVPQGGAYDGIMGVVLPVLALEKLKEDGAALPFAVEILAFADEEGVCFPTALVGSRALAGTVDPGVLDMVGKSGVTLRTAMEAFGLSPDRIPSIRRDPDRTIGFIETHIEQGPVLERENQPVGIVTAICGIDRHRITVTGETGHAGTLPMEGRRDALVGAAALVTEVNRMARETPDLRGTVGALEVSPNAVNAVPGHVRLTAEFRSPKDEIRDAAGEALHRFAERLAADTRLEIVCERTYSQTAQPCSGGMSEHLRRAIARRGGGCVALPSGATHDASAMADLCPVAMLFVRCLNGVSHNPAEYVCATDMAVAVDVLAAALRSYR